LEAKYTASTAPTVSASVRVVDLPRDRAGDLRRPGLQEQQCRLVGQFLGAEKAGERGEHDQEWKQRHQRRQRDMAGDRPAVVGEEGVERIQADIEDVAKGSHISPGALVGALAALQSDITP
jgi:hypothetical protein